MTGRGAQGVSGSVYVFKTKQRNENPFLLVKFRQAGKGKKSPEGKKNTRRKERKKRKLFSSQLTRRGLV